MYVPCKFKRLKVIRKQGSSPIFSKETFKVSRIINIIWHVCQSDSTFGSRIMTNIHHSAIFQFSE